jgi:uncharacterized membrane protein
MNDEPETALTMGDGPESGMPDQPGRQTGTGGAGRPIAKAIARTRSQGAVLAGSVAVLIVASLLGGALAFGAKAACRAGAWNIGVEQFQAHCYTDIYPLYFGEGLAAGQIPYLAHPVEYPVVMGAVMQAAAVVVKPITDAGVRGREFYDVTVALLALFLLAGVLATAYCAGRGRRWTALGVALSPALILGAFINWDLIAMGLMMLGLAAWAARRPWLAGVLLGLAVATKFYPVFGLGPLFLLCLRSGRLRAFSATAGAAVATWLAVNLPVVIAARHGWATFYVFNARRGADWGAIWYFFETEHWPVVGTLSPHALNLASLGTFALACAAISYLALAAPRRPRLPQLIFLTVAAFVLTNKVWSPQYVVWLAPLVVLARPRLGAFLLWQVAEIGYFYAIWGYLITVVAGPQTAGAVSSGPYFAALIARFATVLLLCALVVKDVLRPGGDVVRAACGDDPAGGVLDGAPDRYLLHLGLRRPAAVLAGAG